MKTQKDGGGGEYNKGSPVRRGLGKKNAIEGRAGGKGHLEEEGTVVRMETWALQEGSQTASKMPEVTIVT